MRTEKITVKFRPEQLDDVIDALGAYADDCVNDRQILCEMPTVDQKTINELAERESRMKRLVYWLQKVREEAGSC